MQERELNAAICTTVKTTVTVEADCTETDLVYPPAYKTHKKGTLTTSVPSFCTNQPVKPKGGTGKGNTIFDLSYPYFPQTFVECCVQCSLCSRLRSERSSNSLAGSEQYYDLVAAAFIKSGLDCECLVDTDGNHPGKSNFCPHGIEPYVLGTKPGNTLPGPCRKGSSG